jgi:hypothetical protein
VTDWLLRLCGVKLDQAGQIAGAQVALRNSSMLGWIVPLAIVLGALAWWSYWRDAREMISPARRRVLSGLRMLLFLLLLLLLLRPVLVFKVETSIRRTLLMLFDASGSMNIRDPRFDEADLKRAALAKDLLDPRSGLDAMLDPARAGELKLVPRVEVLKAVLKNPRLALLEKFAKSFDLETYTFGQALAELAAGPAMPEAPASAWVDQLEAKSPSTALGDAVRDLLMRKRGQPLAGIFLGTDGASNTGSQALEAARLARAEGVPLYLYGVGITSPRDIIVANMFTQDVAFVKDELPVTVRVRGQGLRGQSAKMVLRLGNEVVASQELTFADDDEQTVALPFTPTAMGEFELSASIDPRDDEAVKDNNVVTQRLKVIDSKVKVLFAEQAPRWEFRYLQSVLLRDRRLELKCWLVEGDPSIAGGEGSPYLKTFPTTKDELFQYDLVILGDVGPKELGAAPMQWLAEFVAKFGGSCLFLAGPRSNPAGYRGTELEKMLPVELAEAAATKQGPERPTLLELTAHGRTEPMLKLSAKDDENVAIWRRFPKVYSVARVARAKPAAQVLLQDSDETKASKFGKMPVVAQQQFGLGQVFYVGTDNTWRWRRNADERLYPLLWGQIAQKLGLRHLLGGSKRTQLTVDKQSYSTGDRVTVYARLYGADFNPIKDASVEGGYTVKLPGGPAAGERQTVTLRAVPEQPGMYRGDFTALAPGTHQFSVKSDPGTFVEFSVAEPKFESGETAMNEPLLKQMAEISGGAYFREETLSKLAEAMSSKQERVASTVDAELWSSPFYFLLILAVATTEWALRKRGQLK